MNNTSLYDLENKRKELLRNNGLDEESIKEFRDKIKVVDDETKDSLGKQLLDLISKKDFNDDYEKVIELIYDGANIEYKNEKKGDFALLICARKNYFKSFLALIKAGANVNQVNNYLTSSVMVSARHGNHLILEILILLGADINLRCLDGDNAIMSAKRHDQVECFNMLVLYNAYLNNRNLLNQNLLDIDSKKSFDFVSKYSSVFLDSEEDVSYEDVLDVLDSAVMELKKINNL